jgi:hypothetical protein
MKKIETLIKNGYDIRFYKFTIYDIDFEEFHKSFLFGNYFIRRNNLFVSVVRALLLGIS